jgi:hypothetical protein
LAVGVLSLALNVIFNSDKLQAKTKPVIIACEIIIGVYLFVAIVLITRYRRWLNSEMDRTRERASEVEREIGLLTGRAKTARGLYEMSAELVGATRDELIRDSELFEDGHLESYWNYRVRALRYPVPQIEHRHRSDGDSRRMGFEFVDQEAPHGITVECADDSAQDRIYYIKFRPPIAAGSSRNMPKIKSSTGPGAFKMTLEELGTRPFEFCTVRATYPSDSMSLKLTFPPNFLPEDLKYDVWRGHGRVHHLEEFERVRPGFEPRYDHHNHFYVLFNIEFPIPGLQYAITWRPPR